MEPEYANLHSSDERGPMDEFGIQIQRSHTWPGPTYRERQTEGWDVFLPHSCDEWSIAENLSQGEAAALLRDFISEAQKALDFLVSAPPDWDDHYGPNISMRYESDRA